MLEYFSSTHGARKGLADTALKTADSGYLTRKLADVAQNVVITMEDCGTSQGITKGVIYKGEKVEVSLVQSIRGRVSRVNIVNPITDEVVVQENEMITVGRGPEARGHADREDPGPQPDDLRGHRWASAAAATAWTWPPASSSSRAWPSGIIAAQSIGEPGTQLTMRTFHIGGVATRGVEEKDVKAKREGKVKYVGINIVINDEGKKIALSRNGEIQILDPKGRELEKYDVPDGAEMKVEDGQHDHPRHDALRVGPAQHPDPRRGRRQGPLRGHRRGRDDADRDRPLGPRPPDDHRAQGRPAPADPHRGRRGQDPRLQLHPRAGRHRGRRRAR